MAYVPAEKLHVSGVLATVVAGLYIGSRSLDIIEPGTRLRTLAFWDSTAFLLDGLLFVLIGLQVPSILERIDDADLLTLGAYALLIAAVVMGVRMLWMLVVPTVLHSETSRAGADRDRVERDARRRLARRGAGDHQRRLPEARPRDLRRLRGDRRSRSSSPGSRSRRSCGGVGLQESEEHRRRDAEARLRITQAALERLEDASADAGARAPRPAAARPLRLARGAPGGADGGRSRRATAALGRRRSPASCWRR